MSYLAVEALRGRSKAQWEWKPFRRLATLSRRRNEALSVPLLALSSDRGIEFRPDDGGRQLPSDATVTDYWIVEPGDLVFNPMWAIGGGVAVSDLLGAVSPAYRVYKLGPRVFPRFLHYYLRLAEIIKQYGLLVRGLTTFDRSVTREDFEGMPVPVPPLSIQRAIAEYLDAETARIDALVAAYGRLNTLPEEKWRVIVTQAVTKGLDPTVLMKDSGIPWLGDVPAHWQALKLKHLTRHIIDTEHKTAPFYEDGQYLVVRTSNVRRGCLVLDDAKYTDKTTWERWTQRGRPEPGDVILTREAPSGEACLVPEGVDLCVGQRTVLVKLDKKKCEPGYIVHSLGGDLVATYISALSQGSTVSHLNMEDIPGIPILTPPRYEQISIATYLNHQQAVRQTLENLIQQQLCLLAEYRSSLLTASVTGRTDAR